MSVAPTPTTRKLSLIDVNQSLRTDWEEFRSMPAISLVFWGLLLRVSIVSSILLLPLLAVVLPVMSYASFAFYLRGFPPTN